MGTSWYLSAAPGDVSLAKALYIGHTCGGGATNTTTGAQDDDESDEVGGQERAAQVGAHQVGLALDIGVVGAPDPQLRARVPDEGVGRARLGHYVEDQWELCEE
ncbi:uncharacterized protein PgNI_04792 [Pyricularia grisea]|uniref:Uncharacterized protein n=1 Tax=Pyricularia grisea TaxID=148305 RepID=A0A6P8BDT8_PYRGI|nr:uncharacterized protein PgNI_04792 [Pyricularia grisea]TLD13852.1 hypothetical protein PgNI_04792 [Pyricularia grisea]